MSGTHAEQAGVLLRVTGASFGYAGARVLRDVHVEVRAGDMLGIVGANGAGKTTLFRSLLGLIPPTSGHVERPHCSVGYVPQREALDAVYPLNVAELVSMGCSGRGQGWRRLWRAPSARDKQLAAENLAAVGLPGIERQSFAALSGGQRQRVLLARALMAQPELLMLDEPTAGVDRDAAAEILNLIGALNRERGVAVLIVAHQLDQLRTLTREVLLVRDGQVQRGPSEVLLAASNLDALYGRATQPLEG